MKFKGVTHLVDIRPFLGHPVYCPGFASRAPPWPSRQRDLLKPAHLIGVGVGVGLRVRARVRVTVTVEAGARVRPTAPISKVRRGVGVELEALLHPPALR